jgi:hypothetical protein
MDDIGSYYTTDLGAAWGELNTPPETDSDYFTSGLFLNTDFGFVFTYNNQVLRFENQVVTDITERLTRNLPGNYQLNQNFPNPFNPATQISFSLPMAADVKVVIYDMLGRKIRTVFDGYKGIGIHTVSWNGLNDAGQSVASGSYIYQLAGKNINLSKRMQFIK